MLEKDSKPQEGPLLRRFEDVSQDLPGDHPGGHLSDGAHRADVTASWNMFCAGFGKEKGTITEPSKR